MVLRAIGVVLFLALSCRGNEESRKWLEMLPWEARDNMLSLKDDLNIQKLTGPPVPIYRADLGEEIAYWLIRYDHTHYAIITAGDHIGDYRVVLQGESPSPVETLAARAASDNGTCVRYTLLTPAPDLNMACHLDAGTITHTPLADHVNVTALWEAHMKEREEELEESPEEDVYEDDDDDDSYEDEDDVVEIDNNENDDGISASDKELPYYEVGPSQPSTFPLSGIRNARIRLVGRGANGTGSEVSVRELCARLGDVCDEEGRVREEAQRQTDYGEPYLQLKPLEGGEKFDYQHFVVEALRNLSNIRVGPVVKGFMFGGAKSRKKRQTTPWTTYSIDQANLMPNYNQFKRGKCQVGCGPVAWAQIFGYFDRRAHSGSGGSVSQALYRCGSDGTTGSYSCQAPSWTDTRMKGYIGKLNDILRTFCLFGQGATTQKRMDDVEGFFRARQSGGDIRLHARSFFLTRLVGINSKKVRDSALSYIRQKWPVIVGFRVSGIFSQHYAVMTKYRTRRVKKKRCWICRRKWHTEYDMFLHMGWGGSSNGWRSAKMFMAVVAKY